MSVCVYGVELDVAADLAKQLATYLGTTVRHECIVAGGTRDDLRGASFAVLVHAVDGRTLLLDDNGSYNKFVADAVEATGGNVAIALARCPVRCPTAAVAELVAAGQTSISEFHDKGRFLVWDAAPDAADLRRFAELYGGDAFPRAAVTEGMRRRAPPSLQPLDVGAVLATTLSVSKATLSFLVGRCSIRCRDDDAEDDVGEVASALHAV